MDLNEELENLGIIVMPTFMYFSKPDSVLAIRMQHFTELDFLKNLGF